MSLTPPVASSGAPVYDFHVSPPDRSPGDVGGADNSRAPTGLRQSTGDDGNVMLQQHQHQQSPPSNVLTVEQLLARQLVRPALPPPPHSDAVHREKAAEVKMLVPQNASSDSLQQKEALVKAVLARCLQLEQMVQQQRDTIAYHESTIASLERDLVEFCAHAHASVQEAEDAAQKAINNAQVYREQALAAMAREQAAEEALAAASERAINDTKVYREQAAAAKARERTAEEALAAASKRAIDDAKVYREQAAAAKARERTAEEVLKREILAAATTRSLDGDKATVEEASNPAHEIHAQELEVNVQRLQKQLAEQESGHQQQLQSICETYESRMEKLAQVLQLLQMRQQQLSEIDARDEEAAAAHDCDFASLKSIVVPALADGEQLHRLWRSIDVTDDHDDDVCSLMPSACRQRQHLFVRVQHVARNAFSSPAPCDSRQGGAPIMADDFDVLLKAHMACAIAARAFFRQERIARAVCMQHKKQTQNTAE